MFYDPDKDDSSRNVILDMLKKGYTLRDTVEAFKEYLRGVRQSVELYMSNTLGVHNPMHVSNPKLGDIENNAIIRLVYDNSKLSNSLGSITDKYPPITVNNILDVCEPSETFLMLRVIFIVTNSFHINDIITLFAKYNQLDRLNAETVVTRLKEKHNYYLQENNETYKFLLDSLK